MSFQTRLVDKILIKRGIWGGTKTNLETEQIRAKNKEKVPISQGIRYFSFGIPTVRGYNAPCFERMVHYFMGSVLMRWDNEDGKDKIVLLSQKSSLCRAGSFLLADYIRDVSCKCAKAT